MRRPAPASKTKAEFVEHDEVHVREVIGEPFRPARAFALQPVDEVDDGVNPNTIAPSNERETVIGPPCSFVNKWVPLADIVTRLAREVDERCALDPITERHRPRPPDQLGSFRPASHLA
jgi:hypothetical protein